MSLRKLIFQSILSRGLYFLSATVLNIMIARYYEASYSGLLYFMINSYALVVIVGSLSIESGVSYFLASGRVQANEVGFFSLLWTIGITAVISFFLYRMISAGTLSDLYRQYFTVSVLYIGGNILSAFFLSMFYAKKSFFLPNILMTSVNILLIILLLFTDRLISLKEYLDFYFGGFLLQGVLLAIAFFIVYGWNRKLVLPPKDSLKGIFRYAMQALAANVLFFLLYRIDYWFVEKYCSASELGNYIQVSKLGQLFLVIPGMMASAVFPAAARDQVADTKRSLLPVARAYTFLCLFACILIAVSGYWLFPFLFGSSFDRMYRPFLFLVPGILSLSMVKILAAFFSGRNQVWINIAFCMTGLMILLPVDLIVIPRWGIDAAAITSSFAYLSGLGLLIYLFLRNTSFSIRDLILINRSDIAEAVGLLKRSLWR